MVCDTVFVPSCYGDRGHGGKKNENRSVSSVPGSHRMVGRKCEEDCYAISPMITPTSMSGLRFRDRSVPVFRLAVAECFAAIPNDPPDS